jgi:small-conductance mechanosensitive channel
VKPLRRATPLLAALLLAASVRAAEPRAAAPAPVEPTPIPVSEVPVRVEEVGPLLRDVDVRTAPPPEVGEIEGRVAEEARLVAERAAQTLAELEQAADLDWLSDAENGWRQEENLLAEWDRALFDYLTKIETELARLKELRALWTVTSKALDADAAPAPLVQRVKDVLAEMKATRKRVEARLDVALETQSQVAQLKVQTGDVLARIVETRTQMLSTLLARDQRALWSAWRQDAAEAPALERLRAAWDADRAALSDWARRRGGQIPTGLALFVAVLATALALRRRALRWGADDESLRSAARIFERPVAVAFVGFLLVTPVFRGEAPAILRKLATLVLLVPLVRALPPLLEGPVLRLFWLVVAFLLCDRARDLLYAAPFVERSLFAAETAAALAALGWLSRPARLAELRLGERGLRWLRVALRLALAALAVALVANVLGYVRLARLLGDGTLRSTYALVSAYALTRILDGLIVLGLRLRPFRALRAVDRRRARISAVARRGVRAGTLALWVLTALELFQIREPVWSAARAVLGAELRVGELGLSLADVLAFGTTLVVSWLLSRLVRAMLEEDVFPRFTAQRGVPYAVSTFTGYVVLTVGFLLALAAAGIDFGRIIIFASALGVGIGLGLQDVVKNLVSGAILLFERPIQIGDAVQLGDLLGVVQRIGLRSSTVRTMDGAEVIIPNGQLVAEPLVNWTLSDRRRRITLAVGAAYGSDAQRVVEILLGVARSHPRVLPEPAPSAVFMGFGESACDFQLFAWTDSFDDWMQTRSELAMAVSRALAEAGIEIPFPQRDLHLRSVDGKLATLVRGEGEA